jgi:pilus assembly protein CpaC
VTGRPYLLILSVLSWQAGTALAQPAAPPHIAIDREVGTHKELALEVGQNRLLILSEQIVRVSVAEPKVADLKVITPTQLLLTAKGVGATDLTLWNRRDDPFVISLRVGRNLEALRKQLKELFPQETINVTAAGDLVVLSGEVGDVRVPERAAEVAKLHAERMTNLIHVRGNQQVQLEVRFAEVSRKGLRAMAFNVFHQDSLGRFVGGVSGAGVPLGAGVSVPGTGSAGIPTVPTPGAAGAFNVFFSGLPRFPFSAVVSLLESTGLAKILAEPTLVAMSGQEARFLAGGEFPIPTTSGLGATAVTWKRFGIILNFTPTVIDEGTIHLKLQAEVSDVDPARGISMGGVVIPGVSSRQSETTVRLGDGQSFAIAGLLSNRIRHNVDKIPLLGDLPILGALFRSVSYQRDESELLVVVTARLARPLAPHEVPPLPTDYEMNDPGDLELFLLGGEGRRAPKANQGQGPGQGQGKDEPGPQAVPSERASLRRGPSGELGFIR